MAGEDVSEMTWFVSNGTLSLAPSILKIRKMHILELFAGAGFGGDAQYYGTSGPTSTNGYLDTGGGGQYAQHDSSYNPGQYCKCCHSYVCHASKLGLL